MMKKTPILLLLLLPMIAVAQPKVSNLDANPAGKSIALTYDLSERADVSFYVSDSINGQFHKIPAKYLTGDGGMSIKAGSQRRAKWNVSDQYPNRNYSGVAQFKVKALPAFRPFVLATGSYAVATNNGAGGLMAGAVGAVGFYVRGEMSFSLPKECAYSVDAEGKTDGILPFYSGNKSSSAWQATGGLVVRMYIPLYLYVGGGYGNRELYWETDNHEWVRNMGGTYRGFAGDIGLMGQIKHVAIMAGVSSVQFQYTTVHVGIGYAF